MRMFRKNVFGTKVRLNKMNKVTYANFVGHMVTTTTAMIFNILTELCWNFLKQIVSRVYQRLNYYYGPGGRFWWLLINKFWREHDKKFVESVIRSPHSSSYIKIMNYKIFEIKSCKSNKINNKAEKCNTWNMLPRFRKIWKKRIIKKLFKKSNRILSNVLFKII